MTFAGIAYNRAQLKAEAAPKTWKDILNPSHRDGISAKLATSGMQHAQVMRDGVIEQVGTPPETAANAWPARIRQRVFQGDFTQCHLDWDGRQLIVRSAAPDPMAEGDEVFVNADPRHCVLLEE